MRAVVAGLGLALAVASGAAAATTKIGSWTVEETSDAFTDVGAGIAWVDASAGRLAIKCDRPGKNSVYVLVSPDHSLGFFGTTIEYRTTLLRFDQGTTISQQWNYYQDHGYSDRGAPARAITERARDAKQLKVRLLDFEEAPTDLIFDVSGAADAIAMVRQWCGDV